MVMAWVDVKMGLGIIASTRSGRRFSRTVAQQVASAITDYNGIRAALAVPV
jgi:hypothetical protein